MRPLPNSIPTHRRRARGVAGQGEGKPPRESSGDSVRSNQPTLPSLQMSVLISDKKIGAGPLLSTMTHR
jgi:hypothetical protein